MKATFFFFFSSKSLSSHNNSPIKVSFIIQQSFYISSSTLKNETEERQWWSSFPLREEHNFLGTSINPSRIQVCCAERWSRKGDNVVRIILPGQRPNAPTDGYSRFVSLSNRRYALYAWQTSSVVKISNGSAWWRTSVDAFLATSRKYRTEAGRILDFNQSSPFSLITMIM